MCLSKKTDSHNAKAKENQPNGKIHPEKKSNSGKWKMRKKKNRTTEEQECHCTLSEHCPHLLVDFLKQMCSLCILNMH